MPGGGSARVTQRRLIPLAIFAGALAVLIAGARSQGIPRDEAYYFRAGEQYTQFYLDLLHGRRLRDAVQNFSFNSEHPALMKQLFGLSWRVLHNTLGLPEILAFRMPTLLLVAWLCVLLYWLGARLGDPAAGALAAGLTLAQPQLYFHAQLACFDAPIMVLWLAVVYAYFRALEEGSLRWAVLTGVLFGLSQCIKFNTVFLPPVLLAHWIYVRLRGGRPPLAPFIAMATIGPAVFFAHWPWIWFDTWRRLGFYLGFHLHHWHYNFEFLGRNYNNPPYPLAFPWVETALTVPVVTLALALAGLVALARRRPLTADPLLERATRPGALLVANLVAPLAVLNLPGAPIFGGVKHFLAALPFLALLAAFTLTRLARAAASALGVRRPVLVSAALAACALAPATLETVYSHPYGLSYYNGLAGGFAGGADLGMNRQFWGYAPAGLFDWMNATLPRGAHVYFHDLNGDAFDYYRRAKRLRPDIVHTGLEEPALRSSTTALVIHEKHFNLYEYWIWQIYGTTRPVRVLARENVPLVTVYARRGP